MSSEIFSVNSGFAKVATLSSSMEGDRFGFLYAPHAGGVPDRDSMVLLCDKDGTVELTHAKPMVVLALPGHYAVAPLDAISEHANVDVSDKEGFAVMLTVEVRNVAA